MNPELLKALQTQPPVPLQEASKFYKGFLYGEYGVGKTVLSVACASQKALIIATDNGWESIHNHPELVDKVDIMPYDGLSQLTAIAEAKQEELEGFDKYDLFIIDTVSQIQEEYLDWLLENYTFKGALREKATPRSPKLRLAEIDVTGLPDYKVTRDNMRNPLKELIKAPVDVLFLAHLREPNFLEAGTGKLTRRPTLTEAVFKLVAREASFMGLMERDGKERTIQFKTDRKTVSKSRIKELDDQIINADKLPEILQKWKVK